MAENQLPQDEAASTSPSILRRILSLPAIVSLVLGALFLVFIITRFDVDLSATWDRVTGAIEVVDRASLRDVERKSSTPRIGERHPKWFW